MKKNGEVKKEEYSRSFFLSFPDYATLVGRDSSILFTKSA